MIYIFRSKISNLITIRIIDVLACKIAKYCTVCSGHGIRGCGGTVYGFIITVFIHIRT